MRASEQALGEIVEGSDRRPTLPLGGVWRGGDNTCLSLAHKCAKLLKIKTVVTIFIVCLPCHRRLSSETTRREQHPRILLNLDLAPNSSLLIAPA